MLGGLGLLLVVLVVYFVVALARYRSAVRRARQASAVVPASEGEARYLGPSAEVAEDPFALPASEPVPGVAGSTPVAAPQPARVWDFSLPQVHQEPGIASAPLAAPAPLPVAEPLPVAAPLPAPEPAPVPATPATSALPGYSLADELERLMIAAEEPAPLLTPAEHDAAVTPQQPVAAEELTPLLVDEPLYPPLSVGQVLSAPAPAPVRQVRDAPVYALVSPVELRFTGGTGRIGVKPGTRSFVEFQRLAAILLHDLREARGW